MKITRFVLGVFLLINTQALAQELPTTHCYYHDSGAHQRNSNINVTHMLLDVTFEPKEKRVEGIVKHTFVLMQNNVDTVFFDGPGIDVKWAKLDGRNVNFKTIKEGVVVQTHLQNMYLTTHVIELNYVANPKKGIYFIGWDQEPAINTALETRRQIWTQGQAIDNRHWIPMIDDRADKYITEVKVRFDSEYKVLSNGDLLSAKTQGTETVWHYKMRQPHAGYLLMLAIDKYAVKRSKSANGHPIEFWYYPDSPEKLEPSSKYSEAIIDFLENETGVAYPWGKYAQVMVQDFMYGAMENTSATVFGDFFWVDSRAYLDRNYVQVNCHEATHQWFGDLITARHDGDHWLQESFATYYPGIFEEKTFGNDYGAWYFRNNMNAAIMAGTKDNLPVAHSQSGSARHYPKGASVIYMLQHVIGRQNFNHGIENYLNTNAFKGVETLDLQRGIMDATGTNVDWFLDQWVHRGGEPNYEVSYTTHDNAVQLTVKQTQAQAATQEPFKMPIDIAVYYKDTPPTKQTIWVQNVEQTFTIPIASKVDFVLFDEGSFVLKTVNFKKTTPQYYSQLKNAQYMLDRYDALLMLNSEPIESKLSALQEAYKTETFPPFLASIALQLSKKPELIPSLANSKHTEVRKALVNNLPSNSQNMPVFFKMLSDSSYDIVATAIDKYMACPGANALLMLEQVNQTYGHLNNVRCKMLYHMAKHDSTELQYSNLLMELAGPRYEFRTRTNAMAEIKRLNTLTISGAQNIAQACTSFNGRLAGPAIDSLAHLYKNPKNTAIIDNAMLVLPTSVINKIKPKLVH